MTKSREPRLVIEHSMLSMSGDLTTALQLTNVNMFSDCVIKATLDHPNFFMTAVTPTATSASLDTVLRNSGNNFLLERRGDVDAGDIYKSI